MRPIDADALMQTLGITDMDCVRCAWYSKAYRRCKRGGDFEDACIAIEDAPTVDAVPVRKGKWILVKGSNGKDYHKCSYCLHTQDITGVKNYCSVCGARMEGAES